MAARIIHLTGAQDTRGKFLPWPHSQVFLILHDDGTVTWQKAETTIRGGASGSNTATSKQAPVEPATISEQKAADLRDKGRAQLKGESS